MAKIQRNFVILYILVWYLDFENERLLCFWHWRLRLMLYVNSFSGVPSRWKRTWNSRRRRWRRRFEPLNRSVMRGKSRTNSSTSSESNNNWVSTTHNDSSHHFLCTHWMLNLAESLLSAFWQPWDSESINGSAYQFGLFVLWLVRLPLWVNALIIMKAALSGKCMIIIESA